MPKVSVIIPVYNMEKYIEKCMNSVVRQTLEDIEIIVLNDGSTDDSENVIKKYLYDHRIRYYQHHNIGLGPTRNKGVALAKGKYLAFVDSDDFIDKEMLNKLYQKAEENDADVVCCEVYVFKENKSVKIRKQFNAQILISVKNKEDMRNFAKEYYFSRIYSHNAWDKIYRTDLVKNHRIVFGDNKKIFAEDNYFQIQILHNAKQIYFLNEPLYYYSIREDSIMNAYRKNLMQRNIKMAHELLYQLKDEDDENIFKQIIALVMFDFIVMEAINVAKSKKPVSELLNSLTIFRNNYYYDEFQKMILKNKAFYLEPNIIRQYTIWISVILLRYKMFYLVTIIFYTKYKYFFKD